MKFEMPYEIEGACPDQGIPVATRSVVSLQQMQVYPLPGTLAAEPSQWHLLFDRRVRVVSEASYHGIAAMR
jgi:hypothetical protein